MPSSERRTVLHRIKELLVGKARNIYDTSIFHKISLIAFFAWIGLGADPLSSSCYGPAEAFATLGQYHYLGIFIALGTAFTIFAISTSYSQTIELFPSGGGGYLVASKLHSPFVGVISGSALLIDYVLTIAVSVTAGADAIFSFLPPHLQGYKVAFAVFSTGILLIMNLRGVKESILILAPIFLTFVVTHLFAIVYAIFSHLSDISTAAAAASDNINMAQQHLGFYGMIFLTLKAFSMGAGTFTGIEAVTNGLPILREPKVRTGKRTMKYIAISLSFTAGGLMVAYLLFGITPQAGKTLNAVLFEQLSFNWGLTGKVFVYLTLASEAVLLFVAAQSGFITGPRVLSNMAIDRWMPSRLSILSDRLVTKNGVLIMGLASVIVILIANGSLVFLIVLYSINIFITFILTESGMIRHWWQIRRTEPKWKKRMLINVISCTIDTFILITVIVMKFYEGGWITIFVTGMVVFISYLIKLHYNKIGKLIQAEDKLLPVVENSLPFKEGFKFKSSDESEIGKTAVILVNGYNGIGMHTLLNVWKTFGNVFRRFIFVQVGIMDAGNFKGAKDVADLKKHIAKETEKYVKFMQKNGFDAESVTDVGIDILDDIERIIEDIRKEHLDIIVFGGQIVLKRETFISKILHNNIVFSLQKRFFDVNIPFVVMPLKI